VLSRSRRAAARRSAVTGISLATTQRGRTRERSDNPPPCSATGAVWHRTDRTYGTGCRCGAVYCPSLNVWGWMALYAAKKLVTMQIHLAVTPKVEHDYGMCLHTADQYKARKVRCVVR
jgi:hypothetical protein